MLGKLLAAQISLEQAIAELSRSGASTSTADAQLSFIGTLQASIGTASATTLAAIKGEVSAAIARSKSIAQQASEQASAITNDASAALQEAATASRSAVTNAMEFLRHTSLTFASGEDERAYRDREKERNAYIASQPNTPTGHLNAAGATVGQMVDAKANGASGPEFEQKWNELVKTTERLRAEAKAQGLSTEEFDHRRRDDLRRVMKSKGYTDAQIEAQFATNPDPLAAAKVFVKDSTDLDRLKVMAEKDHPWSNQIGSAMPPQAKTDALNLIASLKATGVVATDVPKGTDPHHGTKVAMIDTGYRTV